MLACFPVNLMPAIDSSTWFKRLKTLFSNSLVEVSLKTEAFLSNVSEILIFKLFSMCFPVLQDVGSSQMDMSYPRTSSITVLKFCWPFILARLDTLPSAFIWDYRNTPNTRMTILAHLKLKNYNVYFPQNRLSLQWNSCVNIVWKMYLKALSV